MEASGSTEIFRTAFDVDEAGKIRSPSICKGHWLPRKSKFLSCAVGMVGRATV
jgi:hypothetical protein